MRDAICQNEDDCEAFDEASIACTDADMDALEDEFRESGKTLPDFIRGDMAERFRALQCCWSGDGEDEARERALARAAERLADRLAGITEDET